jgi:hypothetical protein
MAKVHCIGDSHVSLYNGIGKINCISENGKHSAFDSLENFYTYRIGSYLAYNLSKKDHPVHIKTLNIIETLPSSDFILLSLGEIDCRNHIIKQATIKGITLFESTKITVESYIKGIELLNAKHNLILQGRHPSFNATKLTLEEKDEFGYRGTLYERNYVSRLFTEMLIKHASKINQITVIDLFSKLMNANGERKDEYYMDAIHLNNKCLSLLKDEFTAIGVNID